ncbi:hypothetical protein L9F63_001352, partial [Diploptera punctata]
MAELVTPVQKHKCDKPLKLSHNERQTFFIDVRFKTNQCITRKLERCFKNRKPEVSGLRNCSKLLLELSSPAYIKKRTRRLPSAAERARVVQPSENLSLAAHFSATQRVGPLGPRAKPQLFNLTDPKL